MASNLQKIANKAKTQLNIAVMISEVKNATMIPMPARNIKKKLIIIPP